MPTVEYAGQRIPLVSLKSILSLQKASHGKAFLINIGNTRFGPGEYKPVSETYEDPLIVSSDLHIQRQVDVLLRIGTLLACGSHLEPLMVTKLGSPSVFRTTEELGLLTVESALDAYLVTARGMSVYADYGTSFLSEFRSDYAVALRDKFERVLERGGKIDALTLKPRFFLSHQCALLPMAEACAKITKGAWFDSSSHLLWLEQSDAERGSRQIEFLRGVSNCIALKVGFKTSVRDLISTVKTLNPANVPGRICIITTMRPAEMKRRLPRLIDGLRDSNQAVTWVCDPVSSNIFPTAKGSKVKFTLVKNELQTFIKTLQQQGSIPGGIHIEYDAIGILRLSPSQVLELGFMILELLQLPPAASSFQLPPAD